MTQLGAALIVFRRGLDDAHDWSRRWLGYEPPPAGDWRRGSRSAKSGILGSTLAFRAGRVSPFRSALSAFSRHIDFLAHPRPSLAILHYVRSESSSRCSNLPARPRPISPCFPCKTALRSPSSQVANICHQAILNTHGVGVSVELARDPSISVSVRCQRMDRFRSLSVVCTI